ncbi:cellulase family glycosylhydrolase [uncultured Mucilaginibacter sp.]|uniref:glycoside hydrolase 5 family protein n=1 Tax=uncultured Mucilaginibacter sp. TaxID=797541 RepID=UPI0025DDE2C6|nr:cellulase family glycosylhydrolase [uncultured Mucilaginibacter sp.]
MDKTFKLLLLSLVIALPAFAQQGFVKVEGTRFTVDGRPYRYIGTNYWYGGLLATNGEAGKKRLKTELDFLKQHGVTNLRVMVGAEGLTDYKYRTPNEKVLEPEAGKFNEDIMAGLDYLLNELAKRKMKAVLHFTNTWEWSGGIAQYLKWNGYGEQPYPKSLGGYYSWDKLRQYISQFYSCKPCMDELDTYIKYILHRTNSLNGKKYIDDPAIMAWEIINEPRPMEKVAVPAFEAWMSHVSALVKSIDKNHLLTTGSEGDIASDFDLSVYQKIHADKNIDYLTIHIWPKNWNWFKDTAINANYKVILDSAGKDIQKHLQVAKQMNKPMVIEEFGLPRNLHVYTPGTSTYNRDHFYNFIFSKVLNNPGIAGCNFWAFAGIARPIPGQTFWKDGDEFMGDPGGEEQGLNSVFDSDESTWKVIEKYTMQLK